MDKLSKREEEVLLYLLKGNSTKETAEKMFLSPRTIETYRASIRDKLWVKSGNFADLFRRGHYYFEIYSEGRSYVCPKCLNVAKWEPENRLYECECGFTFSDVIANLEECWVAIKDAYSEARNEKKEEEEK